MILRLEVEARRITEAPDLDRILVGEAIGSARVRQVRRRRQQEGERRFGLGELRLELFQLGAHLGDLGDQRLLLVARGSADRLGGSVLFRAKRLDALRESPTALVGGEELVDALRQPPAGERLAGTAPGLPGSA